MSDRSSRDTSDERITFQDSPDAFDYCKPWTNHERPGVEAGGSAGCRSPKKDGGRPPRVRAPAAVSDLALGKGLG
jgi:hypothetical protein